MTLLSYINSIREDVQHKSDKFIQETLVSCAFSA